MLCIFAKITAIASPERHLEAFEHLNLERRRKAPRRHVFPFVSIFGKLEVFVQKSPYTATPFT